MTIDLWALVTQALWGLGLVLLEVAGKTAAAGLAWNRSNRDQQQSFPAWVQRTGRTLNNHKENFPLFATAVVVVHLAGKADRISAAGAVAYVAARALHAVFYILGVTGLRSAAWVAGTVSVFVVLSRLVG